MAQNEVQLECESFCCSICLDLLKDPVTLCCGHSFCMDCIKSHLDTEDQKTIYSCPQCRETFAPRPDLKKSTLFAHLEDLEKTGLQAAPADPCYAGVEDVACDFCTGRKLKALKSCLVCLASYCEEHLQPHHESPPLKTHELVELSKNLQEKICSCHDKMMEMFCHTDQQCICSLCSVDQHKDHDTVSAAAERMQRQRELELIREEIQRRLQDREEDVKVLEQEEEALNASADEAVEDSEKIFTELTHLLQKKSSDVKKQIRSKRKTEVSQVKDLQKKLQQEITELKRRESELKQLSFTQDDIQFLLNYHSPSALSPSTHSSTINVCPLGYFEDMTAAVSQVRGQFQDILTETWTNIGLTMTPDDVLLPEPETRAEFLQYFQELTLDPNTANSHLLLSEGNRKVTGVTELQSYSHHPDRFTYWWQVLSRESLSGRCYWEVEWRKRVYVAVSYKNIRRSGRSRECEFGRNERSWALDCYPDACNFNHNRIWIQVSDGVSSRVGVYLDHSAGLLSFYSISDTMTLLHRVQTTFTQPLYAGVKLFNYSGSTAEFSKPKQT